MRILVTSFGPFNNFKANPSNQIMEMLKQKINAFSQPNTYYEFETIEVSWSGVSKFIEAKKNDKNTHHIIFSHQLMDCA